MTYRMNIADAGTAWRPPRGGLLASVEVATPEELGEALADFLRTNPPAVVNAAKFHVGIA